jgi:hypothetical protein
MLDTLSLILVSHSTYTWLVIDYADPVALNKIIGTIAFEPLCSATLALIVQSFMAYRIYVLKPKLMIVSIAIVVISFVAWGAALAAVVIAETTTGGFAAVNKKIHVPAIVGGVLGTALDIFIAITLVILLRSQGGQGVVKMKRTDRIISTLTVYLITNNLLTSLINASGVIAFFAAPKTLVYEAIDVICSKAYTNTFLSQLNVRESIRGRGAILTQSSNTPVKFVEPNYGSSSRLGTTAEESLGSLQVAVHIAKSESSISDDTIFQNHASSRRISYDEKA